MVTPKLLMKKQTIITAILLSAPPLSNESLALWPYVSPPCGDAVFWKRSKKAKKKYARAQPFFAMDYCKRWICQNILRVYIGSSSRWWFQIFFFHLQPCCVTQPAAWMGRENNDIFYFHLYLGKVSILTNIFQMGWNHQLVQGRNPFCPVFVAVSDQWKVKARWFWCCGNGACFDYTCGVAY